MKRPAAYCRSVAAFSLLEVVAAVGIFAISMVAVIGLFAPVAKSVSSTTDAETATNVASLLSDYLRRQPFADVAARLKVATGTNKHQLTDADNAPASNAADPRLDTQLLFANLDGSKIGPYNDPIWSNLDNEKYFEIALIRQEGISPPSSSTTDADGVTTTTDPDATALVLAYSARLRWPAFVPDASSARRALPAGFNQTGAVRFDNSQKQVFFFSGTVTR